MKYGSIVSHAFTTAYLVYVYIERWDADYISLKTKSENRTNITKKINILSIIESAYPSFKLWSSVKWAWKYILLVIYIWLKELIFGIYDNLVLTSKMRLLGVTKKGNFLLSDA